MPIAGMTIAITGASSGIGEAAARLLAQRGAHVVLAARRTAALSRIAHEITDRGGSASVCEVDVTEPEDLRRLVSDARAHSGRLDALVSNAGVSTTASLSDGQLENWNAMIDTNLRGVLHGISAALPVFEDQNAGHFVTVTSTSSAKWVPGQGVYAATKAGVRAVCEVLRQESAPTIRATIICPGATQTDFVKDPVLRERYRAIGMPADAVAHAIAYALDQPPGIDVGEVVIRSAHQP